MKRIAIIGGGISGLTAAYELELARKRGGDIDWHLYEASDRLGGIIETTRHRTVEGVWVLEGGPDGWVTEKPWARELAVELGLEDELIYSNDAERKTYIVINGELQAMPSRMRMFVPENLSALEDSPLFSSTAKQAYADEITRAEELKASAPDHDESVASFVLRHFGNEVLEKVAGPLLSGVFGGDVGKLSVRSVLAPFVIMEREHGSLILALQRRLSQRAARSIGPIFTSLRFGLASLIEALGAALPNERMHRRSRVGTIQNEGRGWSFAFEHPEEPYQSTPGIVDEVVFALPLDKAQSFLSSLDPASSVLLPSNASSATLVSFCWPTHMGTAIEVPPGFGFLVPQKGSVQAGQLLAATFSDQKFAHRTPPGARAIRVFLGSGSTEHFANTSDDEVAKRAFAQLQTTLGSLPEPDHDLTTVRRWPHSLPQYEVGHLDRMARLDELVASIPGLHLLGNSYKGVGLPDLIREARTTARRIVASV